SPCRRATGGASCSRATRAATSAAWLVTCARSCARWIASRSRPPSATGAVTRRSFASTSRAASSAACARRRARRTRSTSRRTSSCALLGAPSVAALEAILYAGAVMVLFLFVAMVLGLGKQAAGRESALLQPAAWVGPALLAGVLLVALGVAVSRAAPRASALG